MPKLYKYSTYILSVTKVPAILKCKVQKLYVYYVDAVAPIHR